MCDINTDCDFNTGCVRLMLTLKNNAEYVIIMRNVILTLTIYTLKVAVFFQDLSATQLHILLVVGIMTTNTTKNK